MVFKNLRKFNSSMYRLSDSIQIFENHDRKKIIIRNYGEGLVISIDRQNILIELFLF